MSHFVGQGVVEGLGVMTNEKWDRALASRRFKQCLLRGTLWWCTAPVSRPEIHRKQHRLWRRRGWEEKQNTWRETCGRPVPQMEWHLWWNACSYMGLRVKETQILWGNVLRWVPMLLFALVFLSQLLRVDFKRLEGVNGQQHVSNVSLWKRKKISYAELSLRFPSRNLG